MTAFSHKRTGLGPSRPSPDPRELRAQVDGDSIWTPTMRLRWNQDMLEQAWQDRATGKTEWRAVERYEHGIQPVKYDREDIYFDHD